MFGRRTLHFEMGTTETWDSPFARPAIWRVFIKCEPPLPLFITISFDSSLRFKLEGTDFVIRDSRLGFLVAGGVSLMNFSVPAGELYAAWTGIRYVRQVLHLDRLIIEGDSVMVISWILHFSSGPVFHPLVRDIMLILQGCSIILIRQIYRAADWMAFYVAQHSGFIL